MNVWKRFLLAANLFYLSDTLPGRRFKGRHDGRGRKETTFASGFRRRVEGADGQRVPRSRRARHRRIFPDYRSAERRKAKAQVGDNAHMRYFIVHLHRLLDPDAGKAGCANDRSDTSPPSIGRLQSAVAPAACARHGVRSGTADAIGDLQPAGPLIANALWLVRWTNLRARGEVDLSRNIRTSRRRSLHCVASTAYAFYGRARGFDDDIAQRRR